MPRARQTKRPQERLGTRGLSLVTGCCTRDGCSVWARNAKGTPNQTPTGAFGHAMPKPCDRPAHTTAAAFGHAMPRAREAKTLLLHASAAARTTAAAHLGTRCEGHAMPNAHRSVWAHDAYSSSAAAHTTAAALGHAMRRACDAKRSQERLGTRCLLSDQLLRARRLQRLGR
jgi:hypothetical protein